MSSKHKQCKNIGEIKNCYTIYVVFLCTLKYTVVVTYSLCTLHAPVKRGNDCHVSWYYIHINESPN